MDDDETTEQALVATQLGAKLLGKVVVIAENRDVDAAGEILGPATRDEVDAALLLACALIAEYVPIVRVLELSAGAERLTGEV
jgi:hypothetical protein